MPKGRRGHAPQLTPEEGLAASTMVFREAALKYGVSYPTWKLLREGKGFLPFRSEGLSEEIAGSVLEDIRNFPHFATAARAYRLGIGVGALQGFLRQRNLNKLSARLQYAGYQVEVCKPLEIARNRRIVAARPGGLTHIDFKVFGFLRGVHGEPGVRLGGFVVIDSLTSFATVRLAKTGDQFEAAEALGAYIEAAPFEVRGLVLSDNGKSFLSDHFIQAVTNAGLIMRTIRPSHPWSNGKVEAMNKTLKYQCFGAIAGNIETWDNAVILVSTWMEYYNNLRSHGGHANRGLPPVPFYNLWKETPGDDLQKLIALGILRCDQDWNVRLMGSQAAPDGTPGAELPFAFIMDRSAMPSLQVALGVAAPGATPVPTSGKYTNFVHSK